MSIEALQLNDEDMVAEVTKHFTQELVGDMTSNVSAVEVDRLIASAVLGRNSRLRKRLAEALGKANTDAEITFRAQLGLILLLPTDIANDPIRDKGQRDKRGNYAKDRGEQYWRGRMRKYTRIMAVQTGKTPQQAALALAQEANTLQEAIVLMDGAIKMHEANAAQAKAAPPIENYLSAEASIRKALGLLTTDGKDGVPGNPVEAKYRAALIIHAAQEFIAECDRQGV